MGPRASVYFSTCECLTPVFPVGITNGRGRVWGMWCGTSSTFLFLFLTPRCRFLLLQPHCCHLLQGGGVRRVVEVDGGHGAAGLERRVDGVRRDEGVLHGLGANDGLSGNGLPDLGGQAFSPHA